MLNANDFLTDISEEINAGIQGDVRPGLEGSVKRILQRIAWDQKQGDASCDEDIHVLEIFLSDQINQGNFDDVTLFQGVLKFFFNQIAKGGMLSEIEEAIKKLPLSVSAYLRMMTLFSVTNYAYRSQTLPNKLAAYINSNKPLKKVLQAINDGCKTLDEIVGVVYANSKKRKAKKFQRIRELAVQLQRIGVVKLIPVGNGVPAWVLVVNELGSRVMPLLIK